MSSSQSASARAAKSTRPEAVPSRPSIRNPGTVGRTSSGSAARARRAGEAPAGNSTTSVAAIISSSPPPPRITVRTQGSAPW